MIRETINAKNAPAAVGPYVHAVKAGETLYTSGQLRLSLKPASSRTAWRLRLNRLWKT